MTCQAVMPFTSLRYKTMSDIATVMYMLPPGPQLARFVFSLDTTNKK